MTNNVGSEEIQEIKTLLQNKIIIPEGNISKLFELVMPLKKVFRCMICHGLTEPPLIILTRCKKVLACEVCVRRCDRTRCPHCRNEEQFETANMTIFNSILNIVKDI